MTRKHTKRRHYAVTPVIAYAIAGASIMDMARQNRLKALELRTLDAFRSGEATQEDWAIMRGVVVMGAALCRTGCGPEYLPLMGRALAALDAGYARLEQHGRIGRVAGEHEAFAEVCEVHALQRASICMADYEKVLRQVTNESRSGRHRPAPQPASGAQGGGLNGRHEGE